MIKIDFYKQKLKIANNFHSKTETLFYKFTYSIYMRRHSKSTKYILLSTTEGPFTNQIMKQEG